MDAGRLRKPAELELWFRDDGWFNMTKEAKYFGKRVDHFFANEETVKYMAALQKLPGMSGSLVATTVGQSGGTWAHPKLAVAFARWLDGVLLVFTRFVLIVVAEFSRMFSQVIFNAFFASFNEGLGVS